MQKKSIELDIVDKNAVWDSTFQLMSWWKAEEVKNAKVMVVGAGALGNEVLKNLVLLGVGNVLIVEFDHIEYSNLARSILFREEDVSLKRHKADVAAERLKEINKEVNIQVINGNIITDVGLGIFREMDVIISCVDNREARLFINRYAHLFNKTWIDGGIENLAGSVDVYTPNISCYECKLTKAEWKNIKYKLGCADVATRSLNAGRVPTTPISASIVGAIQVQEALKIIHNYSKASMAGSKFYYEGMSNLAMIYDQKKLKDNCGSHHKLLDEGIINAPLSTHSTIKETLTWIKEHFNSQTGIIRLDHELVLQIKTEKSNLTFDVLIIKPKATIKALKEYRKFPDENILLIKDIAEIDDSFEQQELTLNKVGIPTFHIFEIETDDDRHYIQLSNDEQSLFKK